MADELLGSFVSSAQADDPPTPAFILEALQRAFGYAPDEKDGEQWVIYRGYSLIVVHPERLPRVYRRGCGGMYYEIEPVFP